MLQLRVGLTKIYKLIKTQKVWKKIENYIFVELLSFSFFWKKQSSCKIQRKPTVIKPLNNRKSR